MKTQYWHFAFPLKSFNFFSVIKGCLILVAITASHHANAHMMVQSWQNRTGSGPGFSLMPKITLLNTSQNFDSLGSVFNLNNNNSLTRTYFELNASYGFSENFFVFGRLSGLFSSVSGMMQNGIGTNQFGLGDQLIGAAWRAVHLENGTSINLQAESTIPAYNNTNSKANLELFSGDGSFDMTIGAFAEVPLSSGINHQLYLDAGAGYTYRSYGYAATIPWNVQLKRYVIQDGFLFSAGARGTFPLSTFTPQQSIFDTDRNTGALGSYLVGAYGPNWILGQATVGYQDKRHIQYVLGAAYPFVASNAADGIQLSFGVQIDFPSSEASTPSKKPSTMARGKFVEYDLIATVTSVNDQLYLLKIDQGSESGVSVGQIFDIFAEDGVIAKAKVTNVKSEESALRVVEYLKEKTIESNSIAKRVAKQD
jgi:hypothetical protein